MALADTLCMARALHGVEVGGSLAKLATRYNVGIKGNKIVKSRSTNDELTSPQRSCLCTVSIAVTT